MVKTEGESTLQINHFHQYLNTIYWSKHAKY